MGWGVIAGCYTLHLYCENYDPNVSGCNGHRYDEFPHQFYDELGSVCRPQAKRAGWSVNYKTGRAICPKCTAQQARKGEGE
jgi:hypothetical protein